MFNYLAQRINKNNSTSGCLKILHRYMSFLLRRNHDAVALRLVSLVPDKTKFISLLVELGILKKSLRASLRFFERALQVDMPPSCIITLHGSRDSTSRVVIPGRRRRARWGWRWRRERRSASRRSGNFPSPSRGSAGCSSTEMSHQPQNNSAKGTRT